MNPADAFENSFKNKILVYQSNGQKLGFKKLKNRDVIYEALLKAWQDFKE